MGIGHHEPKIYHIFCKCNVMAHLSCEWICNYDYHTRQRIYSYAEYWKHFVMHLNGVHAFGNNSAGNERIWMKFGALRVYCLALALVDYGHDPHISKSGRVSRNIVFFVWWAMHDFTVFRSAKFHEIRTLHGSMLPRILSENVFLKICPKGSFSKKANFVWESSRDSDFRPRFLPKWLQIVESHDRLACPRNVGFPFIPLESTQSDPLACRVRTRIRDHAWFTYLKHLTAEL